MNIDQIIFEKIEKVAKQKKISVSNLIENNIKKTLVNDHPEDFFKLLGAIKDDTFIEPDEIDTKKYSTGATVG